MGRDLISVVVGRSIRSLYLVPQGSKQQFLAFTFQLLLTVILLFGFCGWIWIGHRQDLRDVSQRRSEEQLAINAIGNSLAERLGGQLALARTIAESTIFSDSTSQSDIEALTQQLDDRGAVRLANLNRLSTFLVAETGPQRTYSTARGSSRPNSLFVWQLTRGLPVRLNGPLAAQKRAFLTQLLAAQPNIVAVGELRHDGHVILLEPYDLQLTLSAWDLGDYLRTVPSRFIEEPTAFITHDRFLGKTDGPFTTVVARISRGPQTNLVFFVFRTKSLGIREDNFALSYNRELVFGSAIDHDPANQIPLQLGGVNYSLIVPAPLPSYSSARTSIRIFGLAAILLVAFVVVNQQFARLLIASDSLQDRLGTARSAIEEKSQRIAHDFRKTAVALRALLTNIIDKLDVPETQRFDGLINDIDGYSEQLSRRLVGEALRYSDAQILQAQSYLRGAIDAVAKQSISGPGKKFTLTFDETVGAREPFVQVPTADLSRILNNVITNAVEACEGSIDTRIEVIVSRHKNDVVVMIRDNGPGIPSNAQRSIFDSGFTTKIGPGRGQGLPSARERAQRYGGDVKLVSSSPDAGTVVQIDLPAATTPSWFVDTIKLKNWSVFVVVDDEDMAFEYWSKAILDKFNKLNLVGVDPPQVIHINSPSALKLQPLLIRRATQFLVDHYFENDSQTGLQLIEELRIQDRAILVTNLFEQSSVIEEAVSLNVRILPKIYVLNARLPIELEVSK